MIYDQFQKKAIEHISEGVSVIVSAPTGAGKTAIAEYLITNCRAKKENVIYTAPIKALSNQKFRDFQEVFAGDVGILTGDVSINCNASLLIMTTEIFRNKVLDERHSLDKYSWIIFDEIHFLDDAERGTVWEESLIFLPAHMKMLGLSATIPNIEELAAWIQAIHSRPVKIVEEKNRPVPLHFFFHCQNQIMDNLNTVKSVYKNLGIALDRTSYRRPLPAHFRHNSTVHLVKHLEESFRLPTIYFCFARRRCEYLAEEVSRFDFLSPEEKIEIKTLTAGLFERFGLGAEKRAHDMLCLIEKGIAYHHAGMLPTLKEVVERLFTSRLIKVIFTTETFALGINMPARTVIFDELRKFHGDRFGILRTRDFFQMAGRAGRRGIDTEGFVYSRVNPREICFDELKKIIYSRPEEVKSRFNASYATVINLYKTYGENLYSIYPNSYHSFQQRERPQRRPVDLMAGRVKILKELGYIEYNKITEKGIFAGKIYGYELPLTELYERGFLPNLTEIELGVLALALVFEPRKNCADTPLNKKYKTLKNTCWKTVEQIHHFEKRHCIAPLSKNYYFHLSFALESWMRGERFEKILQYTNSDEGEIVRYFRMAMQVLREILDTPASDAFRSKIYRALSMINHGIVDAEKQLRDEM